MALCRLDPGVLIALSRRRSRDRSPSAARKPLLYDAPEMAHAATHAGRSLARVLAGTDGSERATEAVRQAAKLASTFSAGLTIAYVIDSGRAHDDDVERAAERTLEAASAVSRSLDVEAEVRILSGEPGEALVEHAGLNGVDLLCVGPDSGLLGGTIRVGRVATHVLREAGCSVLVARRASPGFPTRIVCGVDGSEGSVDTALAAAAIAAATGAELRLVHIVPVFRGGNAEWTLEPDEESPPELAPSVTAASSLGVIPIREMAMGRPERALVITAERDGADLVVVGHRTEPGATRVLLGSVSEHVAHHAPCSAMVARTSSATAG
jgi:nucleotide-binding universal stress UspA family protein